MNVRYYTSLNTPIVAFIERHPDDSIRVVLINGNKLIPRRRWDSRDEIRTEITEDQAFDLLAIPRFHLHS